MSKTEMNVGGNIRHYRKKAGLTLTQMESLTGINNGNLSRIERGGQNLTAPTLTKIAEALGVSVAKLLTTSGNGISEVQQDGRGAIPYKVFRTYKSLADVPHGANILMSRLAASEVSDDSCPWQFVHEDPLVFNADHVRPLRRAPSGLAAVVHAGRAMEPRLFDGDHLIVDMAENTIPDNGGIFALVYAGELMVRRLFRRPGGGVIVKCDNQEYPTIDVSREEAVHLTVIGRIKFRSGPGDF